VRRPRNTADPHPPPPWPIRKEAQAHFDKGKVANRIPALAKGNSVLGGSALERLLPLAGWGDSAL
jgi:glutaminase